MSLEGRIDWIGQDPSVIRLTDNGKRRVQIRLQSGLFHRFELDVTISDVDALLRELEQAKVWVREG